MLNRPGRALDPRPRAFFESSLGHDFGRVRIHSDRLAGDSAHAVGAAAYTVGNHVVFGPGGYAPETHAGRELLAHELTHVLQQRDAAVGSEPLAVDEDERLEREAAAAERAVGTFPGHRTGRATIQKKDGAIPVELAPTSPEEAKRLGELGVRLPTVSPETWRAIGGKADRANTPLTQRDRERLSGVKNLAGGASPLAFPRGAQFVVHDTAGRAEDPHTQARKYEEEAAKARGQLGEGAAAYVPTAGREIIARPVFFDPRRATATEFEKRRDIAGVEQREKAFQRIWKATKPTEQDAALSRAFAGLELEPAKEEESEEQARARAIREERIAPAEREAEEKSARTQLTSPLPPRKDPKKERTKPAIMTTAAWAVGEICARLATTPATEMATSEAAAKELTEACGELDRYFAERAPRTSAAVSVEIAQLAGSHCRTDPTEHPGTRAKPVPLVPLPRPAYTESQYEGVARVYLQAAVQAGRFPEIVTHFWVDRGLSGAHCDPRCFDLQHLYDVVADMLGHQRGSTYGAKPTFGKKSGVHNVWWVDAVCGGSPPSGG